MSKAHSARGTDRWTPGSYPREELIHALIDGGGAGVNSHDRPNVLWKIKRLVAGDPELQFGLSGVGDLPYETVLGLVAAAGGFSGDPEVKHGVVIVDPARVLEAFEKVGDRLALAAERGERVLLATGHPTGLIRLYQGAGHLLVEHGAKLLQPLEGFDWRVDGRRRQIRYLDGVAVYTDRASALHTHSPEPMELMLDEVTPDLVFSDHGFAGAAIEAGIDTISIADVNDPALIVAHHLERSGPLVVMDDNVQPSAYWPCFQVMASRFEG